MKAKIVIICAMVFVACACIAGPAGAGYVQTIIDPFVGASFTLTGTRDAGTKWPTGLNWTSLTLPLGTVGYSNVTLTFESAINTIDTVSKRFNTNVMSISGTNGTIQFFSDANNYEGLFTMTVSNKTANPLGQVNTADKIFEIKFYKPDGTTYYATGSTPLSPKDKWTTNTAQTQASDDWPMSGLGGGKGDVPEPATMAGLAGAALIAGLRRLFKKRS